MLSHIVDDCRRLGPLDSFSAFPFENLLGQIKRKIRSSHLPLAQITRRISEGFGSVSNSENKCIDDSSCMYIQQKKVMPCSFRNSCVILKDASIGLVKTILNNDEIELKQFIDKSPFLEYPYNSSFIDVYCVGKQYKKIIITKCSVLRKCMIYPHHNKLSLIHI